MTGWRDRPVLVTGADGFIGSHLVEALVKTGAEVTALAQYNSFDSHGWLDDLTPDVRGSARLVRGDIRDGDHTLQLARGQDVVFHLAALISIPYSYDSPASFVQTNVQGTVNVLQAALAVDPRHVNAELDLGKRGLELIFRFTRDHRDVSLDVLTSNPPADAG